MDLCREVNTGYPWNALKFTPYRRLAMIAIHRVKSHYMLLWPLAITSFFTAAAANGQQLTPSSASINFGNVQTGSSKAQTETLTNGATSVTISTISVTGTAFTLS